MRSHLACSSANPPCTWIPVGIWGKRDGSRPVLNNSKSVESAKLVVRVGMLATKTILSSTYNFLKLVP